MFHNSGVAEKLYFKKVLQIYGYQRRLNIRPITNFISCSTSEIFLPAHKKIIELSKINNKE